MVARDARADLGDLRHRVAGRGVRHARADLADLRHRVAGRGLPAPSSVSRWRRPWIPRTWGWLCVKYFSESADYKRLDPQTRRVRRLILEATFDEPIAPGSTKLFRDMPLSRMGTDAVEVLRDRKIDLPGAANNRLKAIRQVFKFGMKKNTRMASPTFHITPPATLRS